MRKQFFFCSCLLRHLCILKRLFVAFPSWRRRGRRRSESDARKSIFPPPHHMIFVSVNHQRNLYQCLKFFSSASTSSSLFLLFLAKDVPAFDVVVVGGLGATNFVCLLCRFAVWKNEIIRAWNKNDDIKGNNKRTQPQGRHDESDEISFAARME